MTNAVDAATFRLSPQQVHFFQTFGFLKLPGLFAAEIDQISAGFDAVFEADENPAVLSPENAFHVTRDPELQHTPRLMMMGGFVERDERLAFLLEDPRVVGIATSLLGEDHVYRDNDGNLFNCDVYWHPDVYGSPLEYDHIKLYFYLDPLTAETGALRVMPGTQDFQTPYGHALYRTLAFDPAQARETFGVDLEDIPAHTIETQPGDVIVGNFRTLHGSFGGRVGRRLFTINFSEPYSVSNAE